MAEATGVTSSESRETSGENRSETRKSGITSKKNRKFLWIGGGVGALLLLSHKGHSSSNTDQTASDARTQALTDEVAALESGQLQPGGGPPVDTGGGGSSSDGGGIGGGPAFDTTGGPNDPLAGLTSPPPPDAPSTTEPAKHKQTAAEKAAFNKKFDEKWKREHRHANAETHHSGGQGVTVHGRHFPGATGHHVGAARREGGNVTQEVTVNYGGHSDKHTSVNGGRHWQDHSNGPPSRRDHDRDGRRRRR